VASFLGRFRLMMADEVITYCSLIYHYLLKYIIFDVLKVNCSACRLDLFSQSVWSQRKENLFRDYSAIVICLILFLSALMSRPF